MLLGLSLFGGHLMAAAFTSPSSLASVATSVVHSKRFRTSMSAGSEEGESTNLAYICSSECTDPKT